MAYSTPAAADLSTYLGADVDASRASLLISMAEKLAISVVTPLPAGAEAVVLDVAARGYTNPQNVQFSATGPYSTSYGAVSGGLWLTRQNRATLRRLAGGSNAFSIDSTPADAGPANVWAQEPETVDEIISTVPFYGDWDQSP